MIPEFRFGDDIISGKETKSIYFGIWVLFSGKFSTHDEILSNLRLIMILLSFGVKNQLDLGFL